MLAIGPMAMLVSTGCAVQADRQVELLPQAEATCEEGRTVAGTEGGEKVEEVPSGDRAFALDEERLGESAACVITARGSPCRAACWAAAALGCGIVGLACADVSVLTIGGATIPCAWAAIAACTADSAGASLCADSCPP